MIYRRSTPGENFKSFLCKNESDLIEISKIMLRLKTVKESVFYSKKNIVELEYYDFEKNEYSELNERLLIAPLTFDGSMIVVHADLLDGIGDYLDNVELIHCKYHDEEYLCLIPIKAIVEIVPEESTFKEIMGLKLVEKLKLKNRDTPFIFRLKNYDGDFYISSDSCGNIGVNFNKLDFLERVDY
jgi:hypothetical protein